MNSYPGPPMLHPPAEDAWSPEEIKQYWENYHPRVTPAEQVLDTQRRVMEGLTSPLVLRYLHDFMKSVTDVAFEDGGVEEVNKAMSSLFWPAWNEELLAGLMRKELFTARTYQVTAEMSEAVTGTYFNSAGSIGHLVEEELPAEAGFVWLDRPFLSTDSHGLTVANRAVSWSLVTIQYPKFSWMTSTGKFRPQTHPDYFDPWPGLRLNAWFSPYDQDSYWSPSQQKDWEFFGQPLLMAHTSTLAFGTRFGGHPKSNFDMTPDDFAHWVHTLWMFMQAEITVSAQPPIQRNFHRRAERSFKFPPAVNVITLRRHVSDRDHDDRDPEERHIDWTCQWIVQGHHRHLDSYDEKQFGKHHATPSGSDRGHCGVCYGRITWVKPYVKGPDGLPLRSVDQLYRLER